VIRSVTLMKFLPMLLAFENPLNESPLTFPILECIHIVGFAFSVGTIGLVDLRLLGGGMRRQSPAEVAKSMAPWTLFGLGVMLTSGPMLFSSDPDSYYLNWAFQVKMALLLLAIVFHYTVHRKVVASASVGPAGAGLGAKAVACLSLTMWIGVIFAGIFYAFT
jgi:hypothetical protein